MDGKRTVMVSTRMQRQRKTRRQFPRQAIENRLRAAEGALAALADRTQLYIDDPAAIDSESLSDDRAMVVHGQKQISRLRLLLGVQADDTEA